MSKTILYNSNPKEELLAFITEAHSEIATDDINLMNIKSNREESIFRNPLNLKLLDNSLFGPIKTFQIGTSRYKLVIQQTKKLKEIYHIEDPEIRKSLDRVSIQLAH